jgi:hypothetical protein
MGSENICLVYDGNLKRSEVEQRIQAQRVEDRNRNGHQDGYSNDWQTIQNITWNPLKIFEDIGEAEEYCLDNCDKREAVAVRAWYKEKDKDKVCVWVIAGWAAC